jgi:Protein of unknown function (DUF1573)
MKNILSILFLLFASVVSNAQNDRPNAPVFKFIEETHNFGNIKEGPEAVYEFVFTNTGKEPLIIQDCKASCGCTTPDWSRAPVLPGQKGSITVKYDTKGRAGTFNKSIFIASNAKTKGSEKRYEIIITGNVIGSGTVSPDSAPKK